MASLDPLRKRALRRTKAATDKIRRNADKGVFLTGSDFDPRKSSDQIRSMSRRQLESYLSSLNSFTDRSTQFVAGFKGEPLPKQLVDEYRRLERARNIRFAKHEEAMRDVFIRPSGMTVRQRENTVLAKRQDVLRMGGTPDYDPYSSVHQSMSGVVSAEGLKKLIEVRKRQLRPQYLNNVIKAQKAEHIEYLKRHGQHTIAGQIAKLSLRQFDILKNRTQYARSIEFVYPERTEGMGQQTIEQQEDEAYELAKWAATIK